ncbi:MAG: hypothetical protein GY719_33130 [bacterium]|nr:hypothetical protein [bacterium]
MSHLNRRLAACAVPALLLSISCAGPGPQVPETRPVSLEDPYVVSPLDGYPLTAVVELEKRVRDAHTDLVRGLEPAEVEAAGRQLLDEDPGFHPASVLLAQVAYLGRDDTAVVELLKPVADELPDYAAAQLLLGRSSERAGDLPAAFEAFARIADTSGLALRRAEETSSRAIEIIINRLRDEIERGRVEGAEEHLAWLETWTGDSWEALEGKRLVAVEKEDLETELLVLRQLTVGSDDSAIDLELARRLGHLELEIGDVRAGLEQFEQLAVHYPDDPELGEDLDRAKFVWRLQLLPPDVQAISRKGELDRADFATLLFWLVPQIRFSQISNPPIAADILDHPQRDQILRVLNLGLMEVDETLHRFDPGEPATRLVVLRALLALLGSSDRELACLAQAEPLAMDRSRGSVCREAARCRLIAEAAECLPAAAISGVGALELFRVSLDLLGTGE